MLAALGAKPPIYAHLPMILGQTRVTMARLPEFDIAMALRLIEAGGVDPVIAAVLGAAVQAGVRRAQSRAAPDKES